MSDHAPLLGLTIHPGEDPALFGLKCYAEHTHHPEPRYLEQHHLIPRAWQHFWHPESKPVPASGIWAPMTVPLCRTAHGNVHYWLERMMRIYLTLEPGPGHTARAETAVRSSESHIGERECLIATEAMVLWDDAGGSVADLARAGLFGGLYGGNTATDG